MVFEDLSINTGLSLGLVPKDQYFQFNHQQKTNSSSEKSDHFFPSLTLALSSDHQVLTSQEGLTFDASKLRVESKSKSSATLCNRQASSISASFSNPSIKRERDVSSEEVEVEKVSRKVISDDLDEEEISGAGKKLRLAIFQSFILEDSFKGNSTLNPKQKKNLAKRLNLRPRQVEVWFQNRRARSKLKRAELDSELLKKCCEKLTVENGRLQKELQEVKALKRTAPPFYMQLPETTPTICPSCERTGGSFSNENSSN